MKTRVTLEELWEDLLGTGKVTEARLHDPAMHLDGFCNYASGRITVNPEPAVVETLLHELIHRKCPQWAERRVDREAKRLLRTMSHTSVSKWYRRYSAIVRRRKSPVRVEPE